MTFIPFPSNPVARGFSWVSPRGTVTMFDPPSLIFDHIECLATNPPTSVIQDLRSDHAAFLHVGLLKVAEHVSTSTVHNRLDKGTCFLEVVNNVDKIKTGEFLPPTEKTIVLYQQQPASFKPWLVIPGASTRLFHNHLPVMEELLYSFFDHIYEIEATLRP